MYKIFFLRTHFGCHFPLCFVCRLQNKTYKSVPLPSELCLRWCGSRCRRVWPAEPVPWLAYLIQGALRCLLLLRECIMVRPSCMYNYIWRHSSCDSLWQLSLKCNSTRAVDLMHMGVVTLVKPVYRIHLWYCHLCGAFDGWLAPSHHLILRPFRHDAPHSLRLTRKVQCTSLRALNVSKLVWEVLVS